MSILAGVAFEKNNDTMVLRKCGAASFQARKVIDLVYVYVFYDLANHASSESLNLLP